MRPLASEVLADAWFAEKPSPFPPARLPTESELKTSVTSYVKSSYFSKVVLNSVVSQLDAAKLEGLTQVFEAFDTDGSGWLSREELAAGLPGISKLELEYIAEELDANGNNRIDYSEFVACLLLSKRDLIEDVLHHTFSTFDVNNDGEITVDELRLMLLGNRSLVSVLPDGRRVEEGVTTAAYQDVLADIDVSGRGAICFNEFRGYVMGNSENSSREAPELENGGHCSCSSDTSGSARPSLKDGEEKALRRRLFEEARLSREQARSAIDSLHQHLKSSTVKSSRLSSLLSEEKALWSKLAELHDEVANFSEDERAMQTPRSKTVVVQTTFASKSNEPDNWQQMACLIICEAICPANALPQRWQTAEVATIGTTWSHSLKDSFRC
jgi:Ca2+-binding EF-hand superfamily protein